MVYIGEVLSTVDNTGAGRIKVYIGDLDRDRNENDEKWASPLLPKYFNVKPKVGENVVVICVPSANDSPMVRLYVGPIISQPQFMEGETGNKALTGMGLSTYNFSRNPELTRGCDGALGGDEDVSIYGRGNSDLLIGKNSVRMRCGSRLTSTDNNGSTLKFNSANSAFMHMKYYGNDSTSSLKANKIGWSDNEKKLVKKEARIGSVATIAAEEINLISSQNIPTDSVSTGNNSEMLSDHQLANIIEKAHPIVYGDKLVEILYQFREAIYHHVHDWGPSHANEHPTTEMENLGKINFGEMLSENIRAI